MSFESLIKKLYGALIRGDRHRARAAVNEAMCHGAAAEDLLNALYWPTYERLESEFRDDSITTLEHHLGTRFLRVLCDQAADRLPHEPRNGRNVLALCGPTDADELGGQIACDLLECAGFDVAYAGGGVAFDEVLERVQTDQPDGLVLFASAPSDLPEIRRLIDTLEANGACRTTQIVVGGGVFNRAEGLAEEIGADLWAETPDELVEAMLDEPERRATPDQRTVGKNRRQPSRKAA